MANKTDKRRRSTINVARLTMWKQTSDTSEGTTFEDTAYTWDNSLNSVKYTPKMQTNEQYGDGIKAEDFVAKDGGEIDITVNGFGTGDTAYYTKRPDGKINLYKFPKTKFFPEGEDSKQQEGTTISYGTANLKGTYSPLISTREDSYKRYGVDPETDKTLIEKWFAQADYYGDDTAAGT